ncbi:DUF1365 domain-containing protein [Mesorhizobium marinum]|uniref:DUF1365 domain-containing protein n=1 Tax=Mesorhizobium marinum TaxID=3228790 RepID=A0ABV3QVC0_9HYPH
MSATRLYFGNVLHRRLRPRMHRLRYRVFWVLFDLDELQAIERSPLFSHNRFNVLSLNDSDHGDGSGRPLRQQIERTLSEHDIAFDGGAIRLLCMPRLIGYVFNPISIYFCHMMDGRLSAIVYEVHNTFGERHSYVFDAGDTTSPRSHRCSKRFHVSPFMGMSMRYEFKASLPGERFALSIRGFDPDATVIHASMSGSARPFTTANLLRGLMFYPLLPFKVTAAIHWHALQLWFKGIRVHRRPPPPGQSTTPVRASS